MVNALALLAAAAVAVSAAPGATVPVELVETIRSTLDKYGSNKDGGRSQLMGAFANMRQQRLQQHLQANGTEISVNITSGALTGWQDDVAQYFFGVPFAAPPTGANRWRPPQPVQAWDGAWNATWFRPVCPQATGTWELGAGMDEDCLYLNVYAPVKAPPQGGFPVMVFLYGGSWDEGSGSFPLYDGQADETMIEDVVIITINYRLNVFGFLAGDALRAEDPQGRVGNYGFLDQRAAMQWAKANAAAFGGNPSIVTIFGESAGAGSVSNHLVSPNSWGLFERGIIESGPTAGPWMAQPYNTSSTRLPQLAAHLNCPTTGAASLQCLRNMTWQDVVKYKDQLTKAFLEWSPCIDGVDVLDYPATLAADGKIAPGVQIMIGSNRDEGSVFNSAPWTLNASGYPAAIENVVGPELTPTILALYPVSQQTNPWWGLTRALGEGMMNCPSRQSARYFSSPNRQGGPAPTYLYFYQHYLWLMENVVDPVKETVLNEPPFGVMHASELVMVWKFDLALWGVGEDALAKLFVNYWTRFAATGNPNGGTDPVWTPFTEENDLVAVLDLDANFNPIANMTAGLKKDICDQWAQIAIPASIIFGS
jgi:carboxylesterase type B